MKLSISVGGYAKGDIKGAVEFVQAADGWLGTSFSPDQADAHLAHIRAGLQAADRSIEDIDVCAAVSVAIGNDVDSLIQARKPGVAFNMGGMGSATTNFYNDAFQRAGYVEDAKAVQALWIADKREQAVARVPDEMVTKFQAVGTREMVRERFLRYQEVGVNTLNLQLDSANLAPARMALLEDIVDIVSGLN